MSVSAHEGCNSREAAGEAEREPNNVSLQIGLGKEALKNKTFILTCMIKCAKKITFGNI